VRGAPSAVVAVRFPALACWRAAWLGCLEGAWGGVGWRRNAAATLADAVQRRRPYPQSASALHYPVNFKVISFLCSTGDEARNQTEKLT